MPRSAEATGPKSDAALVEQLRAGDEEAFVEVVDAWSASMLRLCRQYVASDSVAEEVVQEAWLAMLKGLPRFRGESSLRTWVYSILVNQARARGASERRSLPFASLAPEDTGPSVDPSRFQRPDDPFPGGWRRFPTEWPEDAVLARETQDVVRAALASLPVRQRTVVALRDIDGHSAEEVSAFLGVTDGNQRVLLHRGRGVVRAHLERYFSGLDGSSRSS